MFGRATITLGHISSFVFILMDVVFGYFRSYAINFCLVVILLCVSPIVLWCLCFCVFILVVLQS